MLDAIHFPVMWFGQEHMGCFVNADQLVTCSKYALRKGFYENLLVVDCNGQSYVVAAAHIAQPAAGAIKRFFSRLVKVELSFRTGPLPIGLEELKHRVCETFDLHPEFWESISDLQELKETIGSAKSFEEVITFRLRR